jgi:hypothetical protein
VGRVLKVLDFSTLRILSGDDCPLRESIDFLDFEGERESDDICIRRKERDFVGEEEEEEEEVEEEEGSSVCAVVGPLRV